MKGQKRIQNLRRANQLFSRLSLNAFDHMIIFDLFHLCSSKKVNFKFFFIFLADSVHSLKTISTSCNKFNSFGSFHNDLIVVLC